MAKPNKPDLAKTLSELETAIEKLENEQSTLHDSLAAFEQGIKLTRQAQKILLAAEQKVKLLLDADGEPQQQEFSESASE